VQSVATNTKLSLAIRLGNAALSYAKYLGKTFWPANLAVVYPHSKESFSVLAAVLCALGVVAVSILVIAFRERRYLFVGWFWFLGTLVPMIGLIQVGVQSMADRYAYIPLLGIFVIVCWGAADLFQAWRVPRALPAVASALVLVTVSFALHRQVGFWSNNFKLWEHTLAITENNFMAEDNVGMALIAAGKDSEALAHFERAHAIRPDDPVSTLNLATFDQLRGNYQTAIDGYQKVLHFTTLSYLVTMARNNMAYSYYSLKQYDRSRQEFEAALQQQPENSSAYRGLGLLAQKSGDLVQAQRHYQRSVELRPTSIGYLLLAQVLDRVGQKEAAQQCRDLAARMTSDLSGDVAVVKQLLAN
jgi:protein O-mannosyl-transferase